MNFYIAHVLILCFSLLIVLDMARHVPLYRALLELLRAIASCTSMVPLLLPLSTENGEEEEEQSECQTSVGTLLAKMKTCVDTYTNRLRYYTLFICLVLASNNLLKRALRVFLK